MFCSATSRKWPHAALFTILSVSIAYSQNPEQPRFEVASIKPGGEILSTKPQRSPGRFTWTTQVVYLIGYAYDLDFSRVSGPGIGDIYTIYTINAVFDPKVTDGALRLMLQSLLAERFNMRFHRLVKEVDGYAISVGKGGIKIKESPPIDEPDSGTSGRGGSSSPINESNLFATMPSSGVIGITAHRAPLSQLTRILGRTLGIPFWDQTDLQGNYDFTFRFFRDLSAEPQTDAPSITTALKELGLVLQKQRGPLETLVVDHIDRPSEN